MENALCGDNIPHGGDGGGNTDGTFGSNGGAASREANGTENGYLKQLPLKKTLVFFFLDFLRGIAMAVFIRKHIHYKLVKIRKLKSFIYEKDFSFLCFLMKMPLRASVLRRGTFGAKVPKTWGPFPWSPNPHRRPKGKIFPLETFSPVRCGLGESETTT